MSFPESRVLGGLLGVAGVLAAVAMPFHPDELAPGALTDPRWLPVHAALFVSFTLSIPGLCGLWLVQRAALRPWGHVAFLVALVGSALAVAMVALEIGALPVAARTDPRPLMELIAPGETYAVTGALFGAGLLTWIPGWVAVGLATSRARVLPRALGLGVAASSLTVAVPIHFVGGAGLLVHALTGAAFGVCWLLAGLAVARGSRRTALAMVA